MAVYKATYCYPFLNTFDGRVTATTKTSTPAQYLKCKIESSNKLITGYSIEVYDENNNRIFPFSDSTKKISPVVELPQSLGAEINIGYNGTYLNVPFFQNNKARLVAPDDLTTTSYNTVYYLPRFRAHYLIGITSDFTDADNAENWVYDAGKDELYYSGFNGILNEELLLTGEIVFVASPGSTKGGLWYVQSSGRLARYFLPGDPSTPINISFMTSDQTMVTITNGIYHDRVYKPIIEDDEITSFEVTDDVMWADCEGNLINFSNNAINYKWIITLYQSVDLGRWSGHEFIPDYREASVGILRDANGMYIDLDHRNRIHPHPWYCDYSNLSIEWYDMSLNRGNILGSTKDRIQISDLTERFLPGDESTDPVIIQDKYLQLLNLKSGTTTVSSENLIQTTPRANIVSYDSSYGHIYPLAGSFTNDLISTYDDTSSAKYIQIYKYSNDPNAVTAHDSVDVATRGNINLNQSTTTIDGVPLVSGMRVLVKDQADAKTNGVYIVDTTTNWSRSGSYKTWANFIGKVLFVRQGENNGNKNFISQARAGGTLYVAGQSPSGDTPLVFSEEQPILLFPNLITKTVSFMVTAFDGFDQNNTKIDGVLVRDGDTALWKSVFVTMDPTIYVFNSQSTPKWTPIQTLTTGIVRINYGKQYSGKFIDIEDLQQNPSSYGQTIAPATAKILKNTLNKTYIKPYVGLNDKMALYFINNIKITYSDSSKKNYLLLNSINTKFWSVEHSTLQQPLPSWGESLDSNVVPYSYEVRSYYKASDENPFSLYDDPYLKLGTANGGYTDITTYEAYKVKENTLENAPMLYYLVFTDDGASGDYFLETNGGTEDGPYYNMDNNELFQVVLDHIAFFVRRPSATALSSRYITLQGNYYQWQQASWESYRWILTDIQGNVLQDTGKKYDKSMSVTFYGLSNDTADFKNHYYAILLVEDSTGQSLSFSLHIVVSADAMKTVAIPFYAQYDCNTHSVLLSYQSNAFIKPSIILDKTSNEALAYVSDNRLIQQLWDDSVQYTKESLWSNDSHVSDWMSITGANAFFGDEVYNWVQKDTYLSNTELLGVKYQYYFEKKSQVQNVDTHFLTILNYNNNSDGEFSLQTQVKLPDNFCSNIIETAIDYGDLTKQLHIQLSVPLKFTSLDGDELNPNRNKIHYSLFTDDSNNSVNEGFLLTANGDYSWRAMAEHSYYFLQSFASNSAFWNEGINWQPSPDRTAEYVHYNTFIYNDSGNIFYPFFVNLKNKTALNTTKFLGNLCLATQHDFDYIDTMTIGYPYTIETNSNTTRLIWDGHRNFFLKYAPSYWAENRPCVRLYRKTGYIESPMNFLFNSNNMDYETPEDIEIYWPDETSSSERQQQPENQYYWEEYEGPTDTLMYSWRKNAPSRWNIVFNKGYQEEWDVSADAAMSAGWKPLTFLERNGGTSGQDSFTANGWLSEYSFLITMRFNNIDLLATHLNDVHAEGREDHRTYITDFKVDSALVGSIELTKIRDIDDEKMESGT